MKKINIFFLFVLFQIFILFWVIGNYEYIKTTWKTAYIEVTGYDPVDIFRGDYVNIAYKLKLNKIQETEIQKISTSLVGYTRNTLYIIPNQVNNLIIWVEKILTEKPKEGDFIEIENPSVQSFRNIKIRGDNNQEYIYSQDWCSEIENKKETYFSWQRVSFNINNNFNFLSYITIVDELWKIDGNQKWVIEDVWICEKFLTFRALSADKFFVSEGTGIPLEEKIRKWGMYAKLKIIKSGKVLLLDIVEKWDVK
jgi:uncharacterized membrane-anchored protein